MRRKVDKILFILGVILVLSGFVISKVSDFFVQKTPPAQKTSVQKIPATPTVVPKITSVLGEANYQVAEVIKVVDGDTIHVLLDNKDQTVRLIGVDTPETVDPRKKVQCFGKEASNFTKQQLSNKTLFLEKDDSQGDRDKYQRILRYVFLSDGTNFNKLLIEQGYAHEYTYDVSYQYQAEFKKAQQEAMVNNRGLWSSCR